MPGLEKLLTEQRNPASAAIDTLLTEEVLRIVNTEDRQVADAVGREIPAIARAVARDVAFCSVRGRSPSGVPQPSRKI
jgi:N-acetylmuramic acid 6-phosphate etherase